MTPDVFRHYRTGVGILDTQHAELFDIINTISVALASGDNARYIESLDILEEKFLAHITFEESLMDVSKYPNKNIHELHHREDVSQILTHLRCAKAQHIAADISRIEVMLLMHIDNEDIAFGKFLRNVE